MRVRGETFFSAAFLRFAAAWYGRSSAFGVGPLPSKRRLFFPPVPPVGPFLELDRAAPRGFAVPAIYFSLICEIDQRGPCAVSSIIIPSAANPSRI